MSHAPKDLQVRLDLPNRKIRVLSKMCAVCGQIFNVNDLIQSHHHSDDPHEPLAKSK